MCKVCERTDPFEAFLHGCLNQLLDIEVKLMNPFCRFGTVKSVNYVKYGDNHASTTESCEAHKIAASAGDGQQSIGDRTNEKRESLEEVTDHQSVGGNGLDFPSEAKEAEEIGKGNNISDNKPAGDTMGDEPCQLGKVDYNMDVEDLARDSKWETFSLEIPKQSDALKDDLCCHDDRVASDIQNNEMSAENKLSAEEFNLEEVNRNSQETSAGQDGEVETQPDAIDNGNNDKKNQNLSQIFEPGCVFVEYRRTEASCTAAHCLHGRLFDDRIVTVEYVPLDVYRARFPK